MLIIKRYNIIKKWDVCNGINFSKMFGKCELLSNIKSLENWNVSNGTNFSGMFSGISSLTDIKSLEKWNIDRYYFSSLLYQKQSNIKSENGNVSDKKCISGSKVIGIDIGSINSCISVYLNRKVEIIHNDLGGRRTPSYVSFTDDEILVGEEAKNKKKRNPINTIFNITRLIGRKYNEIEIFKKFGVLAF